jgi:N-acetylglucosaminyldiphosphoundecaprenol N-acetyl-beta-D-mannosaminyltransferase
VSLRRRWTSQTSLSEVDLLRLPITSLTEKSLLELIDSAITAGEGGWVVTVNLDMLVHFRRNARAREAYLAADLRVADGQPLVWASHVQGRPLPGRVAGSSFSESLIALAGSRGWPVLLLGGSAGAAEGAAELAKAEHPGLKIAADSGLVVSRDPSPEQIEAVLALIAEHQSTIVLVGLGSPKQELLIQRLVERAPGAWFVGVGGTFRFLAREIPRAPAFAQRFGLEWLHRLGQEPGRLGKRYLVDDLPHFFVLLLESLRIRLRGSASTKWEQGRP